MHTEQLRSGTAFTKRDTQIVKGIAILCMMFHHAIPNDVSLPLFLQEAPSVLSLLAGAGKLCVSLLTMLSGYGLAQAYRRSRKTVLSDIKFVASHLLQLLSIYWPINAAVTVALFLVCRTGHSFSFFVGPKDLLPGLLGIRRYVGDWFLPAIMILYAVFPLCYRLTERFRLRFLVLTWLPWVLYFAALFSPKLSVKLNSVPFYLFAFTLGIYLSVTGKLTIDRGRPRAARKYGLLFFAMLCLRILISLPVDVFLSLSILLLMTRTDIFSGKAAPVLEAFGRESANIWLIHININSILYHFLPKTRLFYLPKYLLLIALSFVSAKAVTFIKDKIGYTALVSRIRKAIEA